MTQSIWTHPCGEVLAKRPIVVVQAEDPINVACEVRHCFFFLELISKKLMTGGVSSAPVWDAQHKTFVGMIDFRDIAVLILTQLDPSVLESMDSLQMNEILQKAKDHKAIPAKLASDLSAKDPFYATMAESSFKQAVEILSDGVYRIAVMGKEGIAGVLSQSTVLKHIWEQVSLFSLGFRLIVFRERSHPSLIG